MRAINLSITDTGDGYIYDAIEQAKNISDNYNYGKTII